MRYGLLMSPASLAKIDREKAADAPSLASRSNLFAGSLPSCAGMEIVTHDAIPADRVYKIPHEMVFIFRNDRIRLERFVKTLSESELILNES